MQNEEVMSKKRRKRHVTKVMPSSKIKGMYYWVCSCGSKSYTTSGYEEASRSGCKHADRANKDLMIL
jgi:hypothetical protein